MSATADEPGVAKDSDVETFCALRLFIDSWRWEGVPWYLRSGKCLAETAAEVLVELKPPPQRLFADSAPAAGRANYLRFRLSPGSAVALAARVKRAGKEFVGDQRELYLLDEQPGEETPYERLLGDAMAGDGALFTREDAVEAAWAVVDPVLAPPGSPLQARQLGTEGGRRAHRGRRALAQPDARAAALTAARPAPDGPPSVTRLRLLPLPKRVREIRSAAPERSRSVSASTGEAVDPILENHHRLVLNTKQ